MMDLEEFLKTNKVQLMDDRLQQTTMALEEARVENQKLKAFLLSLRAHRMYQGNDPKVERSHNRKQLTRISLALKNAIEEFG